MARRGRELALSQRSIVWLDYDGILSADVLGDLDTLVHSLPSGSVMLCSFNEEVRSGHTVLRDAKERLDQLRSNFGDRVPYEAGLKDVTPKRLHHLYRTVIETSTQEAVAARYHEEGFQSHQLYFTRYTDGAQMMTYGGLLVSADEQEQCERIDFDRFSFVSRGESPFEIEFPVLTFREVQFLCRGLPGALGSKEASTTGIPVEKLKQFGDFYQYYPFLGEIAAIS